MRARADLVPLGILIPVPGPMTPQDGRRPSGVDAKGTAVQTHQADPHGVISAEIHD
jgi:hypothetical protein